MPSFPWLIGYEAMPLRAADGPRLPGGRAVPTLVVPALEAPRVDLDERLFFDALVPRDRERHRRCRRARRRANALGDLGSRLGKPAHLARVECSIGRTGRPSSSVTAAAIRAVKDPREQAALEAAGAAADRVAAALLAGEIKLAGRSESDVSAELSSRLLAEGHSKVNFAIVGSGPNAASPHHEPGRRVITEGDVVVCDFGGTYSLDGDVGYCSDITRTVVVGEPSKRSSAELYAVLELAQRAALDAVEAGDRLRGDRPCRPADDR